jgi:hypothetical protein
MSDAELRKMLDHAITKYEISIASKDLAYWRKRIQDIKAELSVVPN